MGFKTVKPIHKQEKFNEEDQNEIRRLEVGSLRNRIRIYFWKTKTMTEQLKYQC